MAKKIDYASMFTLRSDGRYQGYWKDTDGNRHAVCDRDPEKLFFKIEAKEAPAVLTFGDAAKLWKKDHWEKIREGTQSSYSAVLDAAIADYGEKLIKDITPGDINRVLLREKANDYSYKHAATVRTVYKLIFNFAIVNGWVDSNPALSVSVPRGLKRTRREAPEDDIIQIIRDHVDDEFGLFPYFLIYTGFRAGEACAVTWGDIDRKKKTICCRASVNMHSSKYEIKDPKTDAGYRKVPLLNDLNEKLIRPCVATDEDFVFPGEDGRQLTKSALRNRWIKWCRNVGLVEKVEVERYHKKKDIKFTATEWKPTLTAHQLRHGYCSILFEAGIDELTAQTLMGHKDYETTRKIYTHLRACRDSKAADKLNAAFAEIGKNDGKIDGKRTI